ncbi:acyltransferase [Pedobacter sp. KBS0701]|uniref:acyltransferase family protein n=1 Tax=Pedobacter sp. KBS0701 TaxID=2578106 RepID=UPI00110D90DC|nr:acyltransferase [Pedobacter sp. KBS0701]QDW25258.1 acyltransferase [Pedobacter sp. KBS0701]
MDRERFYGLDHLRAIAILLVLLYHYRMFEHPAWVDTIGWVGWTGVDLFFVLSGFLISWQLFREIREHQNIKLRTFITKRFFRIIPPYAFTLLLYFCLPFFRERASLPPLWKFISFTQNYGLDVFNYGTFSHAWSLCIEEQFYLFLPLVLLFLLSAKAINYIRVIIPLLIIISIILRYFSWTEDVFPDINTNDFWRTWYMKIYYPTHTRLDGLSIGVLIGYLFSFSQKFKAAVDSYGNPLLLTGMLAVVLSLWFCKDQVSENTSFFGFTLIAVSYGILLLGSISKSSVLSRQKYRITSQLAALSYSVYLSHKGIIHMVQWLLKKENIPTSGNVALFICFTACIITGLFYRLVIEKPSDQVKNLILHHKKQLQ